MPRKGNHTHCRGCGRSREEAGLLSTRGWCPRCGKARRDANNAQLEAHSGPFFEQWRHGMAASVGGVLRSLDAATADGHTP